MKPSLVGRLMLAYAAVIAAVLLSAWWSQRSLGEAERAAERLSERSVQGIDLAAKFETLVRERSRLADYLLSNDPHLLDDVVSHGNQFRRWIDAMADFARTDEEQALLARMRDRYALYRSGADDVIRLAQAGQPEDARARFFQIANDMDGILTDGQRLSTLAESDMRTRRARANAAISQSHSVVLWLTSLGALFSLALGFVLSRYAARPIYDLVLRLGASGAVDHVKVDGDEIGALEVHVNTLLERVRQQERALLQAEKLSELGEIASEIAHETLNPITGVKGMLQALRRSPPPPDQLQEALVDMERQLARVAEIVRRLMRYARPLQPYLRPVAVQEILDRAADAARLAPAARGRTIHVQPVADDLRWELDPGLIEQVLVNLLVNGCEASPLGARVELGAHLEDGGLCLVVRDHGAGIPPVVRERLFHPFFTTKADGNGLGLAVSRNIVREHGGQIVVVPDVTPGSLFRIVIPETGGLCASRS